MVGVSDGHPFGQLVLAHGAPVVPGELWSAWTFNPALVLVAAAGAAYWRGLALSGDRARALGRATSFFAGLAVVAIALGSPLDALSGVLFSAHMVQHLLLTLAAPLFLVLARPGPVLRRALPASARRQVARSAPARWARAWPGPRRVIVAWLAAVVTLWAWHVPVLYDAALDNAAVHALEHATLFATALAFWWTVGGAGCRAVPAYGAASLFMASLAGGVLGALLALSGRPWYAERPGVAQWGLTAIEDQQLAGAIMWMPGGLVYLVAAFVLMVTWLTRAGGPGASSSLTARHRGHASVGSRS